MTPGTRTLLRVLLAVGPLLVCAALLEAVGWWLSPPADLGTVAGRTAAFRDLFYCYDHDLMVRLKPNLDGDFRAIRPDLEARCTTNAAGFRGPDWPAPDPKALRILAIGDSVTFGFGVGDDETWPAVLQRRLQQRAGRTVQVRNVAVPGYSTSQGRILFEQHALGSDFAPDLVVFAFGFNDGFLRPQDDAAMREGERFRHEQWLGRARDFLVEHSWFFGWLLSARPLPTITPRVPPDVVLENLNAVAAAAQAHGIELLLVDSSLPFTYVRDAILQVAKDHDLSTVAFRDAFVRAIGAPPEGRWPSGGKLRIVVDAHGLPVPPAPDGGPALSALFLPTAAARPRAHMVPLSDRGDAGDFAAGDGAWSALVDVAPGARPELAFVVAGLADRMPVMQSPGALMNGVHMLQPAPRPVGDDGVTTLTVRADQLDQPPWPSLVLMPDPIHATAAGCAVMAGAVEEVVLASRAWQEFAR